MARPIRDTPKLKGKIADEFIRKMISRETSKMTRIDKKLSRDIKKNSEYFVIC